MEKLIDADILHNPEMVQIIQVNAVTKAKMKQSLERIMKQVRHGSKAQLPTINYEEIYAMTQGDLRHAIMTLQFQNVGHVPDASGKKRKIRSKSKPCNKMKMEEKVVNCSHVTCSSNGYEKDTKLSAFHALGKLLYAKRQQIPQQSTNTIGLQCKDDRPPLEFIPERVMEESSMGIDGSLTFLSYHSPDFFTDISDLSLAFERFSDGSLFLFKSFEVSAMIVLLTPVLF